MQLKRSLGRLAEDAKDEDILAFAIFVLHCTELGAYNWLSIAKRLHTVKHLNFIST